MGVLTGQRILAMVKPQIEIADVLEMLNGLFESVSELAPIGTGQNARVFSFRAGVDEYVVRFVDDVISEAFGKDQLMADWLASSSIPVPAIVARGTYQDLHYAISKKVPGAQADELSADEFSSLVPSLMDVLDAIHQVDVSDTTGYGPFDEHGVGRYSSWAESLLSLAEEENEGGFYGKWHRMFDETFLDRDYFDEVLACMKSLLKYCPEERYLIHADFGFGNVLAENGKVTAVLDWAEARYGDFLCDVAWLDLGLPQFDFSSRFRDYYLSKGREIPNYQERIDCYQLSISLDSQKWYAKTGQREANDWMKERIAPLVDRYS